MAENCIFCGKDLSFWNKYVLSCGGINQPVCNDCSEKYGKESPLQRARLALDTGRAREPETLTAYIEADTNRQQEQERQRQAREEQFRKARESIRCCGFEMTREGQYTFVDQPTILIPHYTPTMLLFRCEVCGQIKFFDASFFPREEGGTGPVWTPVEPEEPVTCPVCGTRHSPSMGCPTCAMRNAQSGRRPQPAESKAEPSQPKPSRSRSGKKPPWEK